MLLIVLTKTIGFMRGFCGFSLVVLPRVCDIALDAFEIIRPTLVARPGVLVVVALPCGLAVGEEVAPVDGLPTDPVLPVDGLPADPVLPVDGLPADPVLPVDGLCPEELVEPVPLDGLPGELVAAVVGLLIVSLAVFAGLLPAELVLVVVLAGFGFVAGALDTLLFGFVVGAFLVLFGFAAGFGLLLFGFLEGAFLVVFGFEAFLDGLDENTPSTEFLVSKTGDSNHRLPKTIIKANKKNLGYWFGLE